jgi:hypothetical protein
MKSLKIAAFVSVALILSTHFVTEWYIIVENASPNMVATKQAWEMLSHIFLTPVVLIYLFLRIK